jgi:hypothetical protein
VRCSRRRRGMLSAALRVRTHHPNSRCTPWHPSALLGTGRPLPHGDQPVDDARAGHHPRPLTATRGRLIRERRHHASGEAYKQDPALPPGRAKSSRRRRPNRAIAFAVRTADAARGARGRSVRSRGCWWRGVMRRGARGGARRPTALKQRVVSCVLGPQPLDELHVAVQIEPADELQQSGRLAGCRSCWGDQPVV